MNTLYLHNLFLQCSSVSIDTRKIEPHSLFVAIKGERFDANTFAQEALEKGASFVIIDNPQYHIDERTVLVPDSLAALQELARFHREYLGLPIVALTGSNGKTTTKELINVVLSQKFRTGATVGNLNNHIGVPLTLLSFDADTEIGIVEMGANHQKEIEFLCGIAQPDFGYITNFGKAHLEGFGGVEGVIKGKSEMYDYLAQNDKMAFVNLEDPIQVGKTTGMQTFTFGLQKTAANVNILSVAANPFVEIGLEKQRIQSHLIGLYNANNINAAIAIGTYFNVEAGLIKTAIESYKPDNNRSQLTNVKSNGLILDAYNANPSSMAGAIENFIQLEHKNKVAFLGDMFELGIESLAEHQKIVALLEKHPEIEVHFIGKDFSAGQSDRQHMRFYGTFEDFCDYLKAREFHDSLILIKGSRGMALERALELL